MGTLRTAGDNKEIVIADIRVANAIFEVFIFYPGARGVAAEKDDLFGGNNFLYNFCDLKDLLLFVFRKMGERGFHFYKDKNIGFRGLEGL